MDRHHANLATCAVHLAFELNVIGLQKSQKPGQAGHFGLFIGQCLGQKRINPIFGLEAKPGQQPLAALVAG